MNLVPCGRLAPSPTGAQHIGNGRSYLIAWLSARSQFGTLRLRIEDIDSPRIKKNSTQGIFEDLEWLGLNHDDEPIYQSSRLSHYQAALQYLREQELVYPCTCTRSDIEHAASAPHADQEGIVYPGTCAHRSARQADELSQPFAWRFRYSDTNEVFVDLFRGRVEITREAAGGDFVVWKSDGTPAYQLAVVVDDAAMGITEVVRGDDLVLSTPRQLLLYRALGLMPPRFAHVPLVVGPDGRRLAKRHGDTRLQSLRQAGVRPERLIGLLAWSCGWTDTIEEFSVRELLPRFSLSTIPTRPFVLTNGLLKRIGYNTI